MIIIIRYVELKFRFNLKFQLYDSYNLKKELYRSNLVVSGNIKD